MSCIPNTSNVLQIVKQDVTLAKYKFILGFALYLI
jgi:hypothetical protein